MTLSVVYMSTILSFVINLRIWTPLSDSCSSVYKNWADENGFKFSKTKTACVYICSKRKSHDDPFLHLDGNKIKVVKEVKFLGVIFDSKRSFVQHLKTLKKNVQKPWMLLKWLRTIKGEQIRLHFFIFIAHLSDLIKITVA